MPPALDVTEQVVIDMNRWLSGDALLNPPIRADSDSGEWLDRLVDEGASQETALAASDELDNRRKALALLLAVLNDRERSSKRVGSPEDPITLPVH
jgi:RNA polymerase sigma-32 factor